MQTDCATEREIALQPDIWRDWANRLPGEAAAVHRWIATRRPDEIWLCGAGTSAFIGQTLETAVRGRLSAIPLRAIATTDLVARPFDYFRRGIRPLVVSFGRSGDSSESIGTLDLLDRDARDADRLHITCNAAGALATRPADGTGEARVILLPEACHDSGFAMTSSYTTMLLTALACLEGSEEAEIRGNLMRLANGADALLAAAPEIVRPGRAVFLGSGPFTGTARESALKVLELSAGKIVTCWDSTLGFRHGPKAIVDEDTLVTIYLSGDRLTRKYDQDVVHEIRRQFPQSTVITVGCAAADEDDPPDVTLQGLGMDFWDAALFVMVAQLSSVAWSKSLGINVDNPFQDGNLTRVVSGVRLHA